jgi:NgoFVII restriction endonuclease
MITTNLFEEVLIKPVNEGADKLCIVAGFATSTMAYKHLEKAKAANPSLTIELIVGMCKRMGLPLGEHKGFQKLVEEDYIGRFQCSYIHKNPPVHSKLYIWLKDNKPYKAFTGSANYTQYAFTIQREILESCDADEALKYFKDLSAESIYCNHLEVENYIKIYSEKQYFQRFVDKSEVKYQPSSVTVKDSRNSVRVSLLMRNGEVHHSSGLNWAFRGTGKNRSNLNEAYIQLRPEVYRSDFFPPKNVEFSVLTDDGKSLICSRGQKPDASAISTPQGNALLGEYFRNRLGLPYGTKVTRKHLEKYGRTDVEFFKNDDETYEMDFSVEDE